MIKHTQSIRGLLPTICFSVFDHFVGLALKSLKKDYPASVAQTLTKPRKFYIRRSNNKVVSIEIGCIVTADLLPRSDLEKHINTTLFN